MKKTLVTLIISSVFIVGCSVLRKDEFSKRKYFRYPLSESVVEHRPEAPVYEAICDNRIDMSRMNMIKEVKEHRQTNQKELVPVISDALRESDVIGGEKDISVKIVAASERSYRKITFRSAYETKKKSISAKPANESPSDILSALELVRKIFTVILCIVVPPMGIYHKEGKSKYFYITLALCIVAAFLGLFILFYFWALWLVASVLGGLVAFDTIKSHYSGY